MIINQAVLDAMYRGFNTSFHRTFEKTQSFKDQIAMTVKSSTLELTYGWLGQFPSLREWVGDRHVKELSAHGFTLKNKKFESSVRVKRDDIADDNVGIYDPMFSEMGRVTKLHPDTMLFDLLGSGFNTVCYDGQNFFDADHPEEPDGMGGFVSVSNMQTGGGEGWYLLDLSRAVKPLIWQEREDYQFQTVNSDKDHGVFMTDEYLYGIRARVNAGFGLWQLAFGSKADLTEENLKAAYQAMQGFKGGEGQLLNVTPTHLVVGRQNQFKARDLLKASQVEGTSNTLSGLVDLIVSPLVV